MRETRINIARIIGVMSLLVVALFINNGLKGKAEENFLTINIYNEYATFVKSFHIQTTSDGLVSDDKDVKCINNEIYLSDTKYYGYSIAKIDVSNNDLSNCIIDNKDVIVYDENGVQTHVRLLKLKEMDQYDIEQVHGSSVNIWLDLNKYQNIFITNEGDIKDEKGLGYSSRFNLTSNGSNKYYKVELKVVDDNYEFIGWRGSNDNQLYVVGDSINVLNEQEYRAELKPKLKKLTYVGYDGKEIRTDLVEYDSDVKLMESGPVIEGLNFECWSSSNTLNTAFAVTEVKMTGDIKVYGVYKEIRNTITFVCEDGERQVAVNYGTKFTGTDVFDKTGYTTHWFDDNGKEYTSEDVITEDIKLNAKFIPIKVSIEIETNGGQIEYDRCNIEDGKIDYGEIIIIKTIEKYGSTAINVRYNGIPVTNDGSGRYEITITSTATNKIVIEYEKNKHTLTYIDKLNNIEDAKHNIYYEKEVQMQDYKEKAGYEFKGWQMSTGEILNAGDNYIMPNKNVTATALWEGINYTVKIVTGGGVSVDKDEVPEVIVMNIGDKYKLPKLKKDGYTFKGWVANKNKIENSVYTMGTEDDIITAVWEKKDCYITILPNGGFYNGKASIQSIVAKFEDIVKLEIPIREGYKFMGWQLLSGKEGSIEDNSLKCEVLQYRIGATWKSDNGEIIDNQEEKYVKPVDGTVEDGLLLSVNNIKFQFNGIDASLRLKNGTIDISNGLDNEYTKYINKYHAIEIENYQGVTKLAYKIISNEINPSTVRYSEEWKEVKNNEIRIPLDIPDGRYNIYIYIEIDGIKGVLFRTTGVIIDSTSPVVEGIEDINNHDIIINATDNIEVGNLSLNDKLIDNGYVISESGSYTLKVADKAGNLYESSFIVDKDKPTVNVKNKKVYKEVTIKAKDNLSGVEYIKLNSKIIKNNYKIKKDGNYKIEICDKAGNVAKLNIVIDNVKPTIKTIKNNKIYNKQVVIKVSDKNGISSIKLNNKKIKNGYKIKKKGKYKLEVKDKAGNIKKINFKIV